MIRFSLARVSQTSGWSVNVVAAIPGERQSVHQLWRRPLHRSVGGSTIHRCRTWARTGPESPQVSLA